MQSIHILLVDVHHQLERIADLHIFRYIVTGEDLHVASRHRYLVVGQLQVVTIIQRASVATSIATTLGAGQSGRSLQPFVRLDDLHGSVATLVATANMVATTEVGD